MDSTKYVTDEQGGKVNPFRISKGYMTFRFERDAKCGGCNWRTDFLYVMAGNLAQAKEMLNERKAGLCGSCYSDMLAGYEG